jgi:cytochrome c-type biogenesis protein CcmH/NrfG
LVAAEGYLQRLVAINPAHAAGWAVLGENLRRQGNYPAAERAFGRALSLQPSAQPVLLQLAELAVLQGHFSAGRRLFDRLEALNPANGDVAFGRACLEARDGNELEALAWLEKALQRGYRDVDALSENADLALLWNNPRFVMLLDAYFPQRERR